MITLLGLMLLVQGTAVPRTTTVSTTPVHLKDAVREFPRSMLQPRTTGPISMDLNQSAKASYLTLAGIAGLNVVFDPDFRDRPYTPFHVENMDIFDTFDRLSMATGNFVEVLGAKTILVSPDNATKHRDYDLQVLKTINTTFKNSPEDMTAIVTMLRTTLSLRYIAQSAEMKAVVLRETPDRIAAAENLVGQMDRITSSQPIAFDHFGNLYTPDGPNVRKSSPQRSRLQLAAAGPTSIDMNADARTTFQALASMAGLNVLFDADLRSPPIPLKLDNVDILDAMDFYGLATRTFWEPIDGTTILIAPDNQTKRRDYQQLLVKTIPLANNGIPRQMINVMTALRTVLNMRYLGGVTGTNAIAMMDTPAQIDLAEKIITDLGQAAPSQSGSSSLEAGDETGGLLRTRAVRRSGSGTQLNVKATGSISVNMTETVHDSFERLAQLAGLHVMFDDRFKDSPAQPFSVRNVGVLDALDFLSLQTRTFWEPLDSTTILIAPDNQTTRRDLQPNTEKLIGLSKTQTDGEVQEIVRVLRTLLNLRDVATVDKTIAVNDKVENVVLAEKIVADLDK